MVSTAPERSLRGAFHTLTIAGIERLCDDAVAVTFVVPEELRGEYDFEAGQSLTLRRVIDGEDHRRDYSICAAVGERPRVGVRLIPEGRFSRWLVAEVRPGDRIEVQTPRGSFRATPDGGRHLLIAAGSGITPMMSIATTVLTHPDSRVTLLYGNRTSRTVMFAEELADHAEAGISLDTDPRRVAKSGSAQDAAQMAAVEIAATGAASPARPEPIPTAALA